MTIIQITDLHIAGLLEEANGVDTKSNFEKILNRVEEEESPDYLVVSGDLCFKDPDIKVYEYIESLLQQKPYNSFVISGNHDDSQMISKVFGAKTSDEYYYKINDILFLDTGPGYMSDSQWDWLTQVLQEWKKSKVIIFMHHPPKEAMVPHMDFKYKFKQMDRFDELLDAFQHLDFLIFTGHYHVERSIVYKNCNLFITPSCFVQISDTQEEFKPDHYVPAYRRIVLENESVLTTVRYLF